MNKMKRYCLLLILVVSAWMAYAAEGDQNLGIQIGYASPIYRLNSPANKNHLDSTIFKGIKLGIVYETTYIKGFGSMMGINYTYGGTSTKWVSESNFTKYPEYKHQNHLHQLEVFVDWQYKFEIAKNTYIILYSGPTIQANLSYKTIISERYSATEDNMVTYNFNRFTRDGELGDEYNLQRLNVTWGVGAGFEYDRYFLRGGYDFGIMNPYRNHQFAGEDTYTRGRLDQWQIKLGMYIWQDK